MIVQTKITAHSGCEQKEPGSREYLLEAVRQGADAVEMDLRILNHEIYLSHFPLNLHELPSYLTFREALGLICTYEIEVNCDLKESAAAERAMELVEAFHMEERVFFTGEVPEESIRAPFRYLKNVEHYSFIKPEAKLTKEDAIRLIHIFHQRRTDVFWGFNVDVHTLTNEAIALFREAEVPICCWQPDDLGTIQNLMQENVSYLTTNSVKTAVQCRKAEYAGRRRTP